MYRGGGCPLGTVRRPVRTSSPAVAAVLAAAVLLAATLSVAGAGMVAAGVARAQEGAASVAVVDNAYDPAQVRIAAGGTVTWTWEGDNPHSVTSAGGDFDSDGGNDCSPASPEGCGTEGDRFEHAFEEPGEFRYFCKVHGPAVMSGTVVVEPAPSPSPGPSASPSAAPSPSAPASPAPGPSSPPSPSPSPSPEPSPSPASSPTPSPEPEPPPQRAGRDNPVLVGPPPPPAPQPIPSVSPTAARESPGEVGDLDLEAFPSASPAGEDEVVGAVTVPGGDDTGTTRTVLLVIASLSVLGTAGAFGGLVLFGPQW